MCATDAGSITRTYVGSASVDLNGWHIGDLNDPHAYRIPRTTILAPGERILSRHSTLGFGINNSGKTLYLWDSVGNLVDTWTD